MSDITTHTATWSLGVRWRSLRFVPIFLFGAELIKFWSELSYMDTNVPLLHCGFFLYPHWRRSPEASPTRNSHIIIQATSRPVESPVHDDSPSERRGLLTGMVSTGGRSRLTFLSEMPDVWKDKEAGTKKARTRNSSPGTQTPPLPLEEWRLSRLLHLCNVFSVYGNKCS